MSTALFDQLRRLDLPQDGYAIFGSGPLAIRGIIPSSNDLDIICRKEVWERLSQIGRIEFLPEYNVTVVTLSDGSVTFGLEWKIGNFNVDQLIDTAEIIDALPFVRMEHVICYKKIRASEKDLAHLDALKASGYIQ